MNQPPMFWLIDIETYDYDVGFLQGGDLEGKALIISSQLWSIIRGTQVFSILIGPGIFRGKVTKGKMNIDVQEFISCLMFDPTKLRLDEPLPQVDIVNPEVIDPLGTGKREEIVTLIRNLVIERGNVLAGDRLATVQTETSIPETAYYEEVFKRINVSHISGQQRAKFILAGTNGPMYRPFAEHYNKRGFINYERTKVMATPFSKFAGFVDIEVMSDWQIVEKAGYDTKTGIEAIGDEYNNVLDQIKRNEEKFIYSA
ncbi:MAG: hypothetical protein DRO87_07005 [Candidatus Thorarchaeota archaeon]|nr:MAG: hypothetical protein DRP09_12490 [Candidatus Thorarchaeota archaeon]RLI57410.1 MAG: hypothetical protein DRO87_07005 [Candidatus Thorarchaeota archaeon]